MPPTLETIPVEIRHNIYSYLLLDQNVAHAVGPCTSLDAYKLEYETALFRVSKLISTESLQYFYSQNAFFALTLNLESYSNQLFLRKCRTIIPMCGGPEATAPKHIALEIYVSLPEQFGGQHTCGVTQTGPLEPQYILPNNFKFEERTIPLLFKSSKPICHLGAGRQSHGLQRQPVQSTSVTEHDNRETRPQPRRVKNIEVKVDLHQRNVILKKLVAEAQPSKMSTAIFAARHFPHFIHLLNEFVSELHRWTENQIKSALAIKFGPFYDSSQTAQLLVGGLNGILGSVFAREGSTEKNDIPTQALDVPKLALIEVELLGNVSQVDRENITATEMSKFKTISDSIDQVVALAAMGDHSYEHGDFVQAREQYSIAKSLSDNLICRIQCQGYEPRLILKTELIVKAVEVSVRNALALAKADNQLGFGESVAEILDRSEWTIAGQGKLAPTDSNFLADFYWNWGLILEENGAYPKAFLQFEKAYIASPSSVIEAKINEVGSLYTHIKVGTSASN